MKLKVLKSNYFFKTALIIFSISFLFFQSAAYAGEGRKLVPVGRTVGITADLYGISVINTAGFKSIDGEFCSPAAEAGILPGDIIIKINGRDIKGVNELESIADKAESSELLILIRRGDRTEEVKVTPRMSADDEEYKLGLWAKDSVSGIGTITYIDPNSKEFGALGHGICGDDGKIIPISGGAVRNAEVASVRCGEKGVPGELMGIFSDKDNPIGTISKNSTKGIYGKITDDKMVADTSANACSTATREEVKEGAASILSNIDGTAVEEYSAEIVRINKDEDAAKGMVIKITDKRLLEKTGGIVKGMSGSPIFQNDKLIGAVTHVFVNDPSQGYGIFIENMLGE